MNAKSGATDELLAVLDAAEACLRAAMAEALPPAAVLRIERDSTREARRRVAELAVAKDVDLPLGWAEFVEVDAAIDALLQRLPPVRVVERVVARTRPAPAALEIYVEEEVAAPAAVELPVRDGFVKDEPVIPVAQPAWVVGLDGAEPIRPEPEEDEVPSWATAPAEEPPLDEAVAGMARETTDWNDSPFVTYEDQPVYEADDEDGYYDEAPYEAPYESLPESADPVQYVTYGEATDSVAEVKIVKDEDEPLPEWAAVERPVEPEPVRPTRGGKKRPLEAKPVADLGPAEPEAREEEWAFASKPDAAPAEPAVDAYAVLRKERMRLDDFSQVERTLQHADDDETQTLRSVRGARSGPAAVQISADGSGRVLGDEEEDESTHVLELGDTRDYGDEDAIDDDQTGILGVGVVEYDEEEELEEIEEVESGLEDLPGAPELTPAEISALYARALEAGRRNMAEGALLLSDVLDADPQRVDAHIARGRFYLDLGDYPAAISDFLKAEGIAPRDADVQVALGDLFQGRKDYGKAVSYYNRALAIDADHPLALARRGMAHYYRKQFNAAVEDLERAKKLDPSLSHVDTYLSRAKKK